MTKSPSDAKLREALVEALILATNAKALSIERAGQVLDRWDELVKPPDSSWPHSEQQSPI